MPDELKKFLQRELEELKQNKVRAIALGVCLLILLIFLISDDSGGEEIILNETPLPVTKDLPAVNLPEKKSPDGVTLVLGANAEKLFIGDPFAGKEKPKTSPKPKPIELPPIVIQPPPQEKPVKLEEKIILTGTAISGEKKLAMFLRGKETLFLTIGEEIGGKKIFDISPDFVTFEGGEKFFIQKELK
ncbi:MAG: hypothetical protein IKO74_06915 [Selenomonadaceae bacterium]|nr:hypothetical protein [Selenomonadaceae bacterium]